MEYATQVIQLGALGILGYVVIHYISKIYPREAEANRAAIRECQVQFTTALREERNVFETSLREDRKVFDKRFEGVVAGLSKNTEALERMSDALIVAENRETVSAIRAGIRDKATEVRDRATEERDSRVAAG